MMACRRMLLSRHLVSMQHILFYSTKTAELADQMVHFDKRLPRRFDLKPAREPFAKNLLRGIFDTSVLEYPESQDTDRNRAFFEWLQPVEEYMKTVDPSKIDKECNIPEEVYDRLNDFGVFAAYIPEEFGGLGFLEAEYLKLLETLSHVPALALHLAKINRCVDLISKHGSLEQKHHYLSRIANGSISPTCVFSEPRSRDPKQIQARALISEDDKYWILTGHKIFVPNAKRANLYVTFALCSEMIDNYVLDRTLSVLLIDKDSPNISISEPIETVGIRGLPHFNVTFQDTKVPVENLMGGIGDGVAMYTEYLSNRKHDYGAVAISILKNFINTLTHYTIHTQHFNKQLCELDSAKEILGKSCHALYTMEAVTYMTAALLDLYKDQDCTMESSIVQTYCSNECIKNISEGIHLIGTPAYLKDSIYDLLWRDAHSLTVFENSVIDNETFVSLVGLRHVGAKLNETVRKLRNPFHFPIFNYLFGRKLGLGLKLEDHLHPSLQNPAKKLDTMLFDLKVSILELFTKHGPQISDTHMDLRRLHEMISMCYVFSSVIARASRAYCIGLKNDEKEIQMAFTFAFKFERRMAQLKEEISEGAHKNGDDSYKEITEITLQNKGYLAEHPLTRNF